jgi:hypothetical protein
MPVSNTDVLADDQLVRWLVENSQIKIPFYQEWFWQNVKGKTLDYARVEAIPPGEEIACAEVGGFDPDGFARATMVMRDFGVAYSLCFEDLDRYSFPNNLDAVMYAIAKRRLLYTYAAFLGSSDGLPDLIHSNRIVNSGGSLTLDCLDQAYELVTAGTGRPTLIMSHSESLRVYRKLCRDAGYTPERVPYRWYDPAHGRDVPGNVDAFNGTPWLANDMLPHDGQTTTNRIWFMMVGDDGGSGPTRGLTGILPQASGRGLFRKRSTNGMFEDVGGQLGTIPAQQTWVTMPAGLALGSQGALSMIENFADVTPCGEGNGGG